MVYRSDPTEEKVKCNFCNGRTTNKAGFVKSKNKKVQRYYCRDCQRFFRLGAIYREAKKPYASKLDILPSKKCLIAELKEIAKTLGKTPTTKDIRLLSKEKKCHTLENYYAIFGSYIEAVKTAGLKQHYKQEFDKERLLSELRKLGKIFNRPVFERDVKTARRKGLVSPPNHFAKAFGSVSLAIEKSGINKKYMYDDFNYLPRKDGEYLPRAKQYSREDLIKHLRRIEHRLGRIPRHKDIKENYIKDVRPSLKAYINEFGTIIKARKAAHILNKPWQKFTKTELTEQLKNLGKKLGRKPTDRDIVRACAEGETASVQVFANNFGSLLKAYEAADFEVLKPKEYTNQEIIKRLRKLRQKLGKRIGWNDLKRASKEGWCPSPNTVYLRIGNIDKIEEILGSRE